MTDYYSTLPHFDGDPAEIREQTPPTQTVEEARAKAFEEWVWADKRNPNSRERAAFLRGFDAATAAIRREEREPLVARIRELERELHAVNREAVAFSDELLRRDNDRTVQY